MSGPPYKVKALYAYASEHDDDLSFPEGQIISVTQEEDADWLYGEYKNESGATTEGIFPRNFVERFEPVTPPRPARPAQSRQAVEPVPVPILPPQTEVAAPQSSREPEPRSEQEEEDDDEDEEEIVPTPVRAVPVSVPAPVESTKPPPPPREEVAPPPVQATKPAPPPVQPSAETKAKSPPVAEKPSGSSFKDRIAAFNRGGSGPQAPPKPSGLGSGSTSGGFVKKTYMAPPPARNAYVPPTNQAPIAKVYRREDDPEFANQSIEQEPSEPAPKAEEPEEDQPKPMSLKERMAMLQQQQLEQQAKHAEAASKKAKPKPPPKKAAAPPPPRASTDESRGSEMTRNASQTSTTLPERVVPPTRVLSNESAQAVASPEQEERSEYLTAPRDEVAEKSASEADETDGEEEPAHPAEASQAEAEGETEVEGGEEEEEDDDVDPEVRRRLELRERMAKMSGGMGMGMMFGAPPVPGAGARKASKPKSAQGSGHADDPEIAGSPPQAIPVMPGMGMPGMALPGMGVPRPKKQEPEEVQVSKEDEEDDVPISQSRRPEELPDVEDIKQQADEDEDRLVLPEKVVPTRRDSRPPPEVPTSPRVAPPIPAGSRPPPIPPPGSRPGEDTPISPIDRTAPSLPRAPPGEDRGALPPPPHVSSPPLPPTSPPTSVSDKRASRPPPPVPGAIDTSVSSSRAAPPPPLAAPPRARQSLDVARPPPPVPAPAQLESHDADDDYDPYNYESNPLGAPTPTSGRTPKLEPHVQAFPPPPIKEDDDLYSSPNASQSPAARAPPPPPHGSAPRVVPPPPPVPPPAAREESEDEEDEEEDVSDEESPIAVQNPATGRISEELHHAGLPSLGPQGRAPPPPPPAQAPMSPQITRTGNEEFSSLAPRAMPPPPPPQAVVQEPSRQPAPPPPSEPAPRKSYDGRKSLDVLGQTHARRSVDIPRPSTDVGDYIAATDVDLGRGSGWWTQRRAAPPALQGRADVLIDFDESTTVQDVTVITKHVYALYMDYSQTIITARFAEGSPEAELQQRHEPPPVRLRQDQLEAAHSKIGSRVATTAKNKENSVVGDGSGLAFVHDLLRSFPESLPPVGTRAFGALVYANIGNASTQQNDEIRAGDIISFRNAKMQGHRGAMKQKYSLDLKEHVGVVVDWDGTKQKVRAWEQGRESKKIKVESFKLGDLRSGEVKIWRVMSKDWVGWGST